MSLFPEMQLKALSEKEFLIAYIDLLHKESYLVNRVYKLKTDRGLWLTSTTLKGLPDVMAVGHGVTLWTEMKTAKGAVDARQIEVLMEFAERVESNRCWLLRPTDDLKAIANWVRHPEDAPKTYGFDEELLALARANKTGTTTRAS